MSWVYTGRGFVAESQPVAETSGTSIQDLMTLTIPQGVRRDLGVRTIHIRCSGLEVGSGIDKRAWFHFGSQSVFFHPDQINAESWSFRAEIEMRENDSHRSSWIGTSGTIASGSDIFTDNIGLAPIIMKISAQVDDAAALVRQTVFIAELI
jgi:hypothetical protein